MIRFRPLPWLTLVCVVALAVLAGLGTWQLDRRSEKLALIARVEARASSAPVELPPPAAWPDLDLDRWEYHRTTIRGRFDHAGEVLVFTSLAAPRGPHGGPGYWVVTPLRLEGGGVVLVNRGFVPEEYRNPERRPEGETVGPLELTGILRRSEPPGPFTPAPDLAAGVWYARDVASIAAARNIGLVAPYMVDAEHSAPGGLPQGGETRLTFRNEHLGYALTWYGLAVVLVVVYLAFHAARDRLAIKRG